MDDESMDGEEQEPGSAHGMLEEGKTLYFTVLEYNLIFS